MLQLDESHGRTEAAVELDVAADGVAARGRELLRQQIQQRISGTPPTDISWNKLALMVAAIVAVIVAAALFGR